MEKNDGRTFEDGMDRKQKFVLNILNWKCLSFILLEVIRRQAEYKFGFQRSGQGWRCTLAS